MDISKKNITIYDIAKEAKVSPSTVSRVLTGNATVSKDKLERVEAVIEKYQFIPNALARGLKEKRSKVIGIIVPDIKNPYFSNLFYEVQTRAIEENYMVFLCNTGGNIRIEREMVHTLINKQVEAMVIMGGGIDDLKCDKDYLQELNEVARKIPLVITNDRQPIDCLKVMNNDEKGIRSLVEFLVERGYKTAAFIGGRKEAIPTHDRRKYFLQYAKKEGLYVKKEWLLEGGYDAKSGRKLMEDLWAQQEKPEVVCGINDSVAHGILGFAHANRMQIPKDIGIVGCDGVTVEQAIFPSLTTIGTHYQLFGKQVIEAILLELEGKNQDSIKAIDMKLIPRESTK